MRAGRHNLHLGSAHIRRRHVLETTPDSFAFGGVRPIVDEHAVVAPRRAVSRASALSDAEWLDLWRCVRRAQAGAEARRGSVASNLLMTDGTEHIHVHVVPRLAEPPDFPKNDMVFDAMQSWAPTDELAAAMVRPKLVVPPDEARRDRTDAQMAEEAATYRARLGGGGAPDGFVFGRFPISAEHIFYATASTVAFVNLRPLVPGHVFVTPRRSTPRTADQRRRVRRPRPAARRVARRRGAHLGRPVRARAGRQDRRPVGADAHTAAKCMSLKDG